MKKYEYNIVLGDSMDESDLNKMGSEGWELTAVVERVSKSGDGSLWKYDFIFKREVY